MEDDFTGAATDARRNAVQSPRYFEFAFSPKTPQALRPFSDYAVLSHRGSGFSSPMTRHRQDTAFASAALCRVYSAFQLTS